MFYARDCCFQSGFNIEFRSESLVNSGVYEYGTYANMLFQFSFRMLKLLTKVTSKFELKSRDGSCSRFYRNYINLQTHEF